MLGTCFQKSCGGHIISCKFRNDVLIFLNVKFIEQIIAKSKNILKNSYETDISNDAS